MAWAIRFPTIVAIVNLSNRRRNLRVVSVVIDSGDCNGWFCGTIRIVAGVPPLEIEPCNGLALRTCDRALA